MFNERLKEERNRLGMNQTDFGEGCGVTKQAQLRYEKGERKPDSEYLNKAHALGVNVAYVLTGERGNATTVGRVSAGGDVSMKRDEAELLALYQGLSAEQQQTLLNTAKLFAGK